MRIELFQYKHSSTSKQINFVTISRYLLLSILHSLKYSLDSLREHSTLHLIEFLWWVIFRSSYKLYYIS
jgi:hypothetical protein